MAGETTSGAHTRNLAVIVWRHRLIFVTCIALVASTVMIGLAMAPREYTATARIATTPSDELSESPVDYAEVLGTLSEVATSRPVLTHVVRSISGTSVTALEKQVSSRVVTRTLLIQVSATDSDPTRAAKIANSITEALPRHDPTGDLFEFHTTDPASPPSQPSTPNLKLSGLAGAALAIIAATVITVLYDRRIVSDSDVAVSITNADCLGSISTPKDLRGVHAVDPICREFTPLRAIRIAMKSTQRGRSPRATVAAPIVHDPTGGWLEVNLAASHAGAGDNVLLIDTNARDIQRHPVIEAAGSLGFYDVLAGHCRIDDALIDTPIDNLTVLPVGRADCASSSLLEYGFRTMLDDINYRFDVAIIRAASLTESDDARIMAASTGIIIAVRLGAVKRRALHTLIALARQIHAPIHGLIGVTHRPRLRGRSYKPHRAFRAGSVFNTPLRAGATSTEEHQ